MPPPKDASVLELEESILLHLLAHRGHQVRFEADRAVTEFGILRAFEARGLVVRRALADLESNRWVIRRMQYVVGYSEPKVVYTLTPIGHQRAQTLLMEEGGNGASPPPSMRPVAQQVVLR